MVMKWNRKTRTLPKVNTSAMPDIIFMLLFFFMVATTIQSAQVDDIALPTVNLTQSLEDDDSQLHLYLSIDEAEDVVLSIDESSGIGWGSFPETLTQYVDRHRQSGLILEKAIIWADDAIRVGKINELKMELSQLGVHQVEFVHRS